MRDTKGMQSHPATALVRGGPLLFRKAQLCPQCRCLSGCRSSAGRHQREGGIEISEGEVVKDPALGLALQRESSATRAGSRPFGHAPKRRLHTCMHLEDAAVAIAP